MAETGNHSLTECAEAVLRDYRTVSHALLAKYDEYDEAEEDDDE